MAPARYYLVVNQQVVGLASKASKRNFPSILIIASSIVIIIIPSPRCSGYELIPGPRNTTKTRISFYDNINAARVSDHNSVNEVDYFGIML